MKNGGVVFSAKRGHLSEQDARPGWLQRFFDFYSVYFGITAPPPQQQKLMVGILVAFLVVLVAVLYVVAKLVG